MMGDVIFRNESQNVIRKFEVQQARTKKTASKPSGGWIGPTLDQSAVTYEATSENARKLIRRSKSPLSVYSLATNIEDQATCYFIANWVVGSEPLLYMPYIISNVCSSLH